MAKEKECPHCKKMMDARGINLHIRHHHPETLQGEKALPEKPTGSSLDSLSGVAEMVGIDIKAVRAEIVNEVVAELKDHPPEINDTGIEARLTVKLVEKLDSINNKLMAAVNAVRTDLLGKLATMEQAIQPMVRQVVQDNIPDMTQSIAGQLEENVHKSPPQGVAGNGGFGAIVNKLPAEFWANLANNLFGKKQQTGDISMFIKGAKFIDSLKSGDAKGTIESLEQAVKPKE